MEVFEIRNLIDSWTIENKEINRDKKRDVLIEFISLLNKGLIRAAEPDGSDWQTNVWVKRGILEIFKNCDIIDLSDCGFPFFDKSLIPARSFNLADGVRIVPGGSSVRSGAFLAKGVICMPPMYINIGAYVDEGTMIDSHALIGSCAQVGKRCHISAAAQIGGVLEPAGASPVIIEDDCFIGGNCGVYEGVKIRSRVVLSSGVVITASSKVYDIPNNKVIQSSKDHPLEIPAGAVVISGARALKGEFAEANGLSLYAPIIMKYRDEKTDARSALETVLR